MDSYNDLAAYYDILMSDVNYDEWVEYITKIFNTYSVNPKSILDTACGTGNISIPLAEKGYEVWGVDISEDMLTIAENKARNKKLKNRFVCQDITKLDINRKFDCVLCMCDGVNYILDEIELKRFLEGIHDVLNKDGIAVFDISSYFKLYNILGNNIIYEQKDNIYYIWDNMFDDTKNTVEMNITFFVPQGKLFEKFEEIHIQRAYKHNEVMSLIKNCGFELLGMFDEFSFDLPKEDSERIFFIIKKYSNTREDINEGLSY